MPRLRRGVQRAGARAALFQRLRDAPGALEPLHRRARDLRVAPPERPAAARVRGRAPAARLRLWFPNGIVPLSSKERLTLWNVESDRFLGRFIESVEAGGADDAAGFVVNGEECAAGGERVAEENFEDFFLVAVGIGVLFPDEGVGADREEGVEIGGSERPEVEELAGEGGLEVEGHFLVAV